MRTNPFQTGSVVTGRGYIGRTEIFQELQNNIFYDNKKHSSILISGLPRMGKTSLAKKCLSEKDELIRKNICTCYITLSTQYNFAYFLLEIIVSIRDEMKKYKLWDTYLEKCFKEIESEENAYKINRYMKKIFMYLKEEQKIKCIIVIDEFDSADRVFENNSSFFQIFRDYATLSEYNITFIVIARKDVGQIENTLPTGSNLRGAFSERILTGFTQKETDMYFQLMEECGVSLKQDQKEQILYYAGCSPLLLSYMGHGILNTREDIDVEAIDITEIYRIHQKDFFDYYKQLIAFMKKENKYFSIIQILIGPVYNVTKYEIEELQTCGYTYLNHDEQVVDPMTQTSLKYRTLSMHFLEYIRIEAENDMELYSNELYVWKRLIDTEKALRKVIRRELKQVYGHNGWRNKIRDYIDKNKADNYLNATKRDFGAEANQDELDVINIKSLSKIITEEWEAFEEIFNPPYNTRELNLELFELNKARNPLAHGMECLLSEEKLNVDRICKRLQQIFVKYNKRRNV